MFAEGVIESDAKKSNQNEEMKLSIIENEANKIASEVIDDLLKAVDKAVDSTSKQIFKLKQIIMRDMFSTSPEIDEINEEDTIFTKLYNKDTKSFFQRLHSQSLKNAEEFLIDDFAERQIRNVIEVLNKLESRIKSRMNLESSLYADVDLEENNENEVNPNLLGNRYDEQQTLNDFNDETVVQVIDADPDESASSDSSIILPRRLPMEQLEEINLKQYLEETDAGGDLREWNTTSFEEIPTRPELIASAGENSLPQPAPDPEPSTPLDQSERTTLSKKRKPGLAARLRKFFTRSSK